MAMEAEFTHPAYLGEKRRLEDFQAVFLFDLSFSQEFWHPCACTCFPGDLEAAERFKMEGNESYKAGDLTEALENYTKAIEQCPFLIVLQSIYHCNRAAVLYDLNEDSKVTEDCSLSIQYNPKYIKPYYRRAQAYERQDKLEEALTDYRKVLELDPHQPGLPPKVNALDAEVKARTEKLKNEMMGKLKDFGNTILGKFGLSLDNFKLQQDPSSGSYNIQFQH